MVLAQCDSLISWIEVLSLNVFELLIFLVNCVVGIVGALFGFRGFGWVGAVAGFFLGFTASLGILALLLFILDRLLLLQRGRRVIRCPCGKCGEGDVVY